MLNTIGHQYASMKLDVLDSRLNCYLFVCEVLLTSTKEKIGICIRDVTMEKVTAPIRAIV